jgi:hypothetical protein
MAAFVNAGMQKRDVGKDQGNIPQANDFKSVVQITLWSPFAHGRFLWTETLLVSFIFNISLRVQAREHGHFWGK